LFGARCLNCRIEWVRHNHGWADFICRPDGFDFASAYAKSFAG